MKKSISVFLFAVAMITVLCLPIYARYSYITQLSGGLSIDSSGLANCSGLVIPSRIDTRTNLKVTLEHYVNGNWNEIDSWTNSGSGTISISKSGKRYRQRKIQGCCQC